MREIKWSTAFKKDYRRIKKGRYAKTLDKELTEIVNRLIHDQPLPESACDHALIGKYKDCRDCHIYPDLVLIYRKTEYDELELIRMESHSNLSF
ncbi:MAG: type II toxin-antitoxin system YafQ family toxin [Alphaproteobacteria bacterium]